MLLFCWSNFLILRVKIFDSKNCNSPNSTIRNFQIQIHRIDPFDVFFINEGQFFSDLKFYVDYLVNRKNKKVYVCGLDGDFRREKFGTLLDIIPICDDIVKLKALCIECKKSEALFTYRLTNDKEQKVVGGSESYCALCRSCYNSHFYGGVEIV